MTGWTTVRGTAISLPQANIDTDQLIPARFMSQPRAAGYGDFLLHDVRAAQASHPLNDSKPQVLLAGSNFGSGSSREAAVYALVDFGIRAVFAPSFGDIFAGNAVNNSLLAAKVDADTVRDVTAALGSSTAVAEVDLEMGRATIAGLAFDFDLDPVSRQKLINGWDDIDLTLDHADKIKAFRRTRREAEPWAMPEH